MKMPLPTANIYGPQNFYNILHSFLEQNQASKAMKIQPTQMANFTNQQSQNIKKPSYQPQIKKHACQSMISTRKDSEDSTEIKGKFKTEICKYWLLKVYCPFQKLCCFAHGVQELRVKELLPTKYKTKKCSRFVKEGYCPYGARCQFIHEQPKISDNIKYQQIVEKIKNNYNSFYELLETDFKKKPRRLSFFEEISEFNVTEKNEKKEELQEDNTRLMALYSRIRRCSI